MHLKSVQQLLERIYGVEIAHAVDDFLVTDPSIAEALDGSTNARSCDEKLLVHHEADQLALSLFIDEEVISRLERDNPWTALHEDNLQDFCTALEGVSHFLYLIYKAEQARPVTRLELELQADVDKYVSAHVLLNAQGASAAPRGLLAHLFEHVSYDALLERDEHLRYREANAYAGRYCQHLESRFLGTRSPLDYYDELRSFYRMPQAEKLRRIEHTRRA